ncbi:MAG: 1-deoxy-D-xylulose-5-phosphate reductoisomerase [Candidatus Acetothermia bacterium]|jgi:1-deoxy-D-xylulose-5-phosphate reductoisomerase|nr:1-deoxy-D-xylulose-5-phosphate reductoisomerase [Candidatus Acetothermia bacterium]MDH7505600.1 1-deoxy-D-xylulose-5-phosphate reductoisomerase [Candidatus Acetothermia bacterium]
MVRVALLGSTGSIGRQTLEVIRALRPRFEVLALAAGSNLDLLVEQIREFQPVVVSVGTAEAAGRLRHREVIWGERGLAQIAALPEADIIVNGLVGAIGLAPTLAALEAGKRLCLANKESLVIGGHLVRRALASGGELIPIDSEHSAIFQLLEGRERGEIERIILTASGGALRDRPLEELERVTPEEVLQHPNWRMGPRITVDSATLANKGFEVIEAHWLFGLEYDQIEALLHPQSVVHGLVQFVDGSLSAGLSSPDMRLSIQYALTYPERLRNSYPRLELVGRELAFAAIDPRRYPAFEIVVEAGRLGGTMPAAINAADEVLVSRFLRGEIPFTTIAAGLKLALERHSPAPEPDLEAIMEADRWGRRLAEEIS